MDVIEERKKKHIKEIAIDCVSHKRTDWLKEQREIFKKGRGAVKEKRKIVKMNINSKAKEKMQRLRTIFEQRNAHTAEHDMHLTTVWVVWAWSGTNTSWVLSGGKSLQWGYLWNVVWSSAGVTVWVVWTSWWVHAGWVSANWNDSTFSINFLINWMIGNRKSEIGQQQSIVDDFSISLRYVLVTTWSVDIIVAEFIQCLCFIGNWTTPLVVSSWCCLVSVWVSSVIPGRGSIIGTVWRSLDWWCSVQQWVVADRESFMEKNNKSMQIILIFTWINFSVIIMIKDCFQFLQMFVFICWSKKIHLQRQIRCLHRISIFRHIFFLSLSKIVLWADQNNCSVPINDEMWIIVWVDLPGHNAGLTPAG